MLKANNFHWYSQAYEQSYFLYFLFYSNECWSKILCSSECNLTGLPFCSKLQNNSFIKLTKSCRLCLQNRITVEQTIEKTAFFPFTTFKKKPNKICRNDEKRALICFKCQKLELNLIKLET